ncbi:hypothetical protein GCM10027217_34920 [Pseudomaricurvus hydrocarbonicus]
MAALNKMGRYAGDKESPFPGHSFILETNREKLRLSEMKVEYTMSNKDLKKGSDPFSGYKPSFFNCIGSNFLVTSVT